MDAETRRQAVVLAEALRQTRQRDRLDRTLTFMLVLGTVLVLLDILLRLR